LADQDEFFSEHIWRLPNSFLCFAPPKVDLPVVPLPAINSGQVTFGCFNQFSKVTDQVVAVWSKILSAVPGSRLVLKMAALSDDKVVDSARARFAVQGISGDRLILEGGAPYEEYLARYHDIDIALDPFPYPGGATTIESLWMAVPVLTKRGGLLPLSRQGASLMHNAGLSDWIAEDDGDYIAKAIAFAGDIDRLGHLRSRLRQQVVASPLFDGQRFAGDFEIAMQGMWKCKVDGSSDPSQ
jgi:protein O-GlcNAc transferase